MIGPRNFDWFNHHGYLQRRIPKQCWQDCSTPGQDASESVEFWRNKLGFTVPREMAINWLASTGAWPCETDEYDLGLEDMTDDSLATNVLWLACCNMRENGEWIGMTN